MSTDTPLGDDDITTSYPGDEGDAGGDSDSDSGDSAEDRDGVDQGVPGGTYGTEDAGRSDTLDRDGVDQGLPGGTRGSQDAADGDADAGDA